MKGWFARVLDALEENRPVERRGSPRKPVRDLHANYFAAGGERACRVADVSLGGAFIESPARWGVGTLIMILFQVDPLNDGAPASTRVVQARVARSTPEGFGVEFVFLDKAQRLDFHRFVREHEALVRKKPQGSGHTQRFYFQ